ncbi:GNAT family N-acetyltransferase [Deinococcus sp. Arct2-2]|nr:GNAT family N-acetyltransferase [Deinococcus sp. Arct2-2]
MTVEFRRLSDVPPRDVVALHNHPRVRRTLPLAQSLMDETGAQRFIAAKERLWEEHGYGPWAFFVGDRFAGWGGLQPEGPDADLGLVLHPDFWGLGQQVIPAILRRAFSDWGLPSVTVLLPQGLRGTRAATRFGFRLDGKVMLNEVGFVRYRLLVSTWRAGQKIP